MPVREAGLEPRCGAGRRFTNFPGHGRPDPYSVADRVARITLNRPEKRNALSFALRRQLVDALRKAEADDDG